MRRDSLGGPKVSPAVILSEQGQADQPITKDVPSISWNVTGILTLHQQARLEIVFQNCQPRGDVNLPYVAGLKILGPAGRRNIQSNLPGVPISLAFTAVPIRSGRLIIPDFLVRTNQGLQTVPRLVLNAVDLPSVRSSEDSSGEVSAAEDPPKMFPSIESERSAIRTLLIILAVAAMACLVWYGSR